MINDQERTIRSALLRWSDAREDPNDIPARMVRSWHMDLARTIDAALNSRSLPKESGYVTACRDFQEASETDRSLP